MNAILRALVSRVIAALAGPWRGLARVLVPLLPRRRLVFCVRGRRMAASSPDRVAALLLWKAGWLEHEEEAVLSRELKPGMTAVDVGANIGFHTLLMAGLVGPTGRVIAFEPDPDNLELLRGNVRLNGCANVECVGKAVSDRTGRVSLYRAEEHHGDHRIFDSRDGRPSLTVEAVRLDDFLPASSAVDLIKIDVQGSEMMALEGMSSVLERNKDIRVLCEFSPEHLILGGADPERFLAFWAARDFKTYVVDYGGGLRLETDARSLRRRCPDPGHLNLFLSRR